jgi:two-component system sensor histidine kinase KdpD
MPFLIGVVVVAVRYGRDAAIFSSVVGVLSFDFFLIPPNLNFLVNDTEYVITFLALFIVGLVISSLTAEVKERAVEALRREQEVSSLYSLSHDLAVSPSARSILQSIYDHMQAILQTRIVLCLRWPEEPPHVPPLFYPEQSDLDEPVVTGFNRVLNGNPADRFSAAGGVYFPLSTAAGVHGAVFILDDEHLQHMSEDQGRLFDAYLNLSGLALERIFLERSAHQNQLLKAREDFQTTLLNSISHDLRTPLAAITGTLSSLQDDSELLSSEAKTTLVHNALHESRQLNRLVGNLLDMTRLEGGALQLKREWVDVEDLVGSSLEQLGERTAGRSIQIQIAEDLPLVSLDFVLINQVLVNVIDNALKYSEGEVEIFARQGAGGIAIEIRDRGLTIPENERLQIFEKFYQLPSDKPRSGSSGLGLAISKGILEAHGAGITVQERSSGGNCFTIRLPLNENNQNAE